MEYPHYEVRLNGKLIDRYADRDEAKAVAVQLGASVYFLRKIGQMIFTTEVK